MHLSSSTLQMSEELRISVTPSIYTSTFNLRRIDPERRGCLFRDEVWLINGTNSKRYKSFNYSSHA